MTWGGPTGAMLSARGSYRRWLNRHVRVFSQSGLLADDQPILLRDIFVPLRLSEQPFSDDAPDADVEKGSALIETWITRLDDDAYRGRRVLHVAGPAGSGKSTLVRAIVDSLAGSVPDAFNRVHRERIAVPLILREMPVDELDSLEAAVDRWFALAQHDDPELDPRALRRFLDEGAAIIMLDGLDELVTPERRRRVLDWCAKSSWVTGAESNVVIVTARPTGFEGLDDPTGARRDGALRLHLAPFIEGQVREFLRKWYALRPIPEARQRETVDALTERLMGDGTVRDLRRLARRPSYLTSLAFVHGTRGALPHSRAVLYDQLVDAYIETLDSANRVHFRNAKGKVVDWDRAEKRDLLGYLAWYGLTKDKQKRQYAFTRDELVETLGKAIGASSARYRSIKPGDERDLVEFFIARTGLLAETREGGWQFGHLSFQEYLGAVFVLDRASASPKKLDLLDQWLLARLDNHQWYETVLLALAVESSRTAQRGHWEVLRRLDPEKPGHIGFLLYVLAGQVLPMSPEEREVWLVAALLWGVPGYEPRLNDTAFIEENRESLLRLWRESLPVMADGVSVTAFLHGRLVGLRPPTNDASDDPLMGTIDFPWPSRWDRPTDSPIADDVWLEKDYDTALGDEGALLRIVNGLGSWEPHPRLLPAPPPRLWGLGRRGWELPDSVYGTLSRKLHLSWGLGDPGTINLSQRWRRSVEALPFLVPCIEAIRLFVAANGWPSTLGSTPLTPGDFAPYFFASGSSPMTTLFSHLRLRRLDHRINFRQDALGAVELWSLMQRSLFQRSTFGIHAPLIEMLRSRGSAGFYAIEERLLSQNRYPLITKYSRPLMGLAIDYAFPTERDYVTRGEVEALRAHVLDPDAMTAHLADPEERARRRQEWLEFLETPWSPVPTLDRVLETMTGPIHVARSRYLAEFDAALIAIATELGIALPDPAPASEPTRSYAAPRHSEPSLVRDGGTPASTPPAPAPDQSTPSRDPASD